MPQLIELQGEQADKSAFPVRSPVYVYDGQAPPCMVCPGTVSGVLLQMGRPGNLELFYKVDMPVDGETSRSELLRESQLRFRNGCRVYVSKENDDDESRMETVDGVVLGLCDIPANDDRCKYTSDKFWYSVQILGGDKSVTQIMHEVSPSQVRYRRAPNSKQAVNPCKVETVELPGTVVEAREIPARSTASTSIDTLSLAEQSAPVARVKMEFDLDHSDHHEERMETPPSTDPTPGIYAQDALDMNESSPSKRKAYEIGALDSAEEESRKRRCEDFGDKTSQYEMGDNVDQGEPMEFGSSEIHVTDEMDDSRAEHECEAESIQDTNDANELVYHSQTDPPSVARSRETGEMIESRGIDRSATSQAGPAYEDLPSKTNYSHETHSRSKTDLPSVDRSHEVGVAVATPSLDEAIPKKKTSWRRARPSENESQTKEHQAEPEYEEVPSKTKDSHETHSRSKTDLPSVDRSHEAGVATARAAPSIDKPIPKKKISWRRMRPSENESQTKEHNGKQFHWCTKCNFGQGLWVNHHMDFHIENRSYLDNVPMDTPMAGDDNPQDVAPSASDHPNIPSPCNLSRTGSENGRRITHAAKPPPKDFPFHAILFLPVPATKSAGKFSFFFFLSADTEGAIQQI